MNKAKLNGRTVLELNSNLFKALNSINSGRFFTVTFMKANGEIRVMNCRKGVKAFVNGNGKSFNDIDYNLVTVWDAVKRAYRSFKWHKIININADGVHYYNSRYFA